MSTTNERERFHFLDGLRGISISFVALYHAFATNFGKFLDAHGLHYFGFFFNAIPRAGLEMFFVLSALVTLRPFLRGQKKFEGGKFFGRRIKRIYPPYFVAFLFGTFVVYLNTYYPTWYSAILMRLSWESTIKQLFILQTGATYYNLAWWSIQVEFVFYLLVPLIIATFPKPAKIKDSLLFKLVFITGALAVCGQYLFTRFAPELYSTDHVTLKIYTFIDFPVCFMLGTYMAAKDTKIAHALILLFSGVFVVAMSLDYPPIFHSGAGMACAGFTMLAFHSQSLKTFLSKPIMIWIGERSYSIYLIHFSVYYFVNYLVSHITSDRNAMYAILTRTIELPLALFFSMLLFHFVERKQARGLVTATAFWPWQAKHLKIE